MSVTIATGQTVSTAAVKLMTATITAIAIGLIAGLLFSWTIMPLVTWDALALTFVIRTWLTVRQYNPGQVKSHALREDPSRPIADLILLLGVIASLAAIAVLLLGSVSANSAVKATAAALSLLSVVASWLIVHTIFALRYAELFYTQPVGGVNFGSGHQPTYADFAYLAFTIGMTYQVSDTNLTTGRLRNTVLRHALLSFVLGTGIIATAINLVVGLAK